MDTDSYNEMKRLEKLDEMRRAFQSILGSHIGLLVAFFMVILAGFLALFYVRAKSSSSRYEAKVILHYHPVKTKNIQPYNDKYVMHILNRESLRRQFTADLTNGNGNLSGSGAHNIKIEQEGRQNDYFVISLAAATEKDAVEFVNKLGEFCIRAYISERQANLEETKSMLESKRAEFSAQMAQVAKELNDLNFTAVMVAPERNYEYLQNRLTTEKAELSRQMAVLAALEQRRKVLEESKADVHPALLPNIARILEYQEDLGKIRQELKRVKELYTSQNPKVMALEGRLRSLEEEFHGFLESQGLAVDDLALLESAPTVLTELDEVNAELGSLQAKFEVQQQLVTSLEQEIVEFNEKYPLRQQLIRQQGKFFDVIAALDESLADIAYLEPMADKELFLGESAHDAVEHLPFTKESISLAVLGAVMVTCFLTFVLLLLGYRYGRMSSESEVEGLANSHYLGILPSTNSMLPDGLSERLFFSGVSHQFNAVEPRPQVVLVGRLPGGELRKKFISAFAEDCQGEEEEPVLVLELVEAGTFKTPADRDLHRCSLVVYSGVKGYVPVENTNYLNPREEAKLRQDMLLLRKMFHLICLVKPTPLTQDGVFLEQVATACDAVVVAIGMRKTPRRLVRRLQELQDKVRLTVMTVLSGRVKSC